MTNAASAAVTPNDRWTCAIGVVPVPVMAIPRCQRGGVNPPGARSPVAEVSCGNGVTAARPVRSQRCGRPRRQLVLCRDGLAWRLLALAAAAGIRGAVRAHPPTPWSSSTPRHGRVVVRDRFATRVFRATQRPSLQDSGRIGRTRPFERDPSVGRSAWQWSCVASRGGCVLTRTRLRPFETRRCAHSHLNCLFANAPEKRHPDLAATRRCGVS